MERDREARRKKDKEIRRDKDPVKIISRRDTEIKENRLRSNEEIQSRVLLYQSHEGGRKTEACLLSHLLSPPVLPSLPVQG